MGADPWNSSQSGPSVGPRDVGQARLGEGRHQVGVAGRTLGRTGVGHDFEQRDESERAFGEPWVRQGKARLLYPALPEEEVEVEAPGTPKLSADPAVIPFDPEETLEELPRRCEGFHPESCIQEAALGGSTPGLGLVDRGSAEDTLRPGDGQGGGAQDRQPISEVRAGGRASGRGAVCARPEASRGPRSRRAPSEGLPLPKSLETLQIT